VIRCSSVEIRHDLSLLASYEGRERCGIYITADEKNLVKVP